MVTAEISMVAMAMLDGVSGMVEPSGSQVPLSARVEEQMQSVLGLTSVEPGRQVYPLGATLPARLPEAPGTGPPGSQIRVSQFSRETLPKSRERRNSAGLRAGARQIFALHVRPG